MDKFLNYQHELLAEEPTFDKMYEDDYDLLAEFISVLPSLRPFALDQIVDHCFLYNGEFKRAILKRSIEKCPKLSYLLFETGYFQLSDIIETLKENNKYHPCLYFRNFIGNFKEFTSNFDDLDKFDIYLNDEMLDSMISYGFPRNSIEYFLKYDDLESLKVENNLNNYKIAWSPFEWTADYRLFIDGDINLLGFCGYFGSIKCFRYLIINGYLYHENDLPFILCGGNHEIINIIAVSPMNLCSNLKFACIFCHLDLIKYILEQEFPQDKLLRKEIFKNPLHHVSEFGLLPVISHLLDCGFDANETDEYSKI